MQERRQDDLQVSFSAQIQQNRAHETSKLEQSPVRGSGSGSSEGKTPSPQTTANSGLNANLAPSSHGGQQSNVPSPGDLAAAAQAQNRPQDMGHTTQSQNHGLSQQAASQNQQAMDMFGGIDLSGVDPAFLEGLSHSGMDMGFSDADFSFNEFLLDPAMGDGDGDPGGD
jgi:hypothetical protein